MSTAEDLCFEKLMQPHFLFTPGEWLGEGEVSFSFSPDKLTFKVRWVIFDESNGSFCSVQTVQIDSQEPMVNIFKCTPTEDGRFDIILENADLGSFQGGGIIHEKSLAWEFRHPGALEGYEIYERVSDTEYSLHAEYCGEDVRTIISGHIHALLST